MASQSQGRALMLLPNELIAKVIRFTLPSGFENFMLTCKHVHALGTPLIAAHNERKKLWSTFGLEHSEDAQNADPTLLTALDFIHTVAVQDEIVPAYIKELNFGCGVMIGAGFMSSNYTMKTQLQARNKGKCQWWNNESAVRQMRNLVTRSRYLRASGVDVEAWADKMFNMKDPLDGVGPSYAFQMHSFIFILTLLVNVSAIKISAWSWTKGLRLLNDNPASNHGRMYPELRQVLNCIARNANDYNRGAREGETAALSNLGSLTQPEIAPITNDDDDEPDDITIPLCCYKPFFALDTLDDIYTTHCAAVELDPSSRFSSAPFQSPSISSSALISSPGNPSPPRRGLRNMSFIYGVLCPTSFARFLDYAAPSLDIIVLECDGSMFNGGETERKSLDVGGLIAALGRSSGASLTVLEFKLELDFIGTDGIVPVKSLNEFERLDSLDVPIFCFLGVEPGDKKDDNSEAAIRTRELRAIEAVPRLRDILPSSLKTLELWVTRSSKLELALGPQLLKALLRDFDVAASGLSRLRVNHGSDYGVVGGDCKLLFNGSWTSDTVRSIAEGAGAEFHCVCYTCCCSRRPNNSP